MYENPGEATACLPPAADAYDYAAFTLYDNRPRFLDINQSIVAFRSFYGSSNYDKQKKTHDWKQFSRADSILNS